MGNLPRSTLTVCVSSVAHRKPKRSKAWLAYFLKLSLLSSCSSSMLLHVCFEWRWLNCSWPSSLLVFTLFCAVVREGLKGLFSGQRRVILFCFCVILHCHFLFVFRLREHFSANDLSSNPGVVISPTLSWLPCGHTMIEISVYTPRCKAPVSLRVSGEYLV